MDVFGRGKVAKARDNHLGAGSFERDCRTLYVNYSGAISHMQTGLQVPLDLCCLPGPSRSRTWLHALFTSAAHGERTLLLHLHDIPVL